MAAEPLSPPEPRGPGLRVATVAGVPVHIGGSWALIAVVVVALVGPQIARGRPDLGLLAYAVAALFALGLLLAVLVHEAAHAVAARAFGMPVLRVVADLWGGHTAFESGRATPRSAAVVALVGPLANGVLALLAYLVLQVAPSGVPSTLAGGFAVLNAALAAFNLLPGLPLDGGQLVESAVWKLTGSRNRGMVVAGWCGRVVTVLVLAWVLGRPLAQGRGLDVFDIGWGLFIAAFLWAGATSAIRGGRTLERVGRVRVQDVLRPALAVAPGLTVAQALARVSHDQALVVLDAAGRPSALVDPEAVRSVPAQQHAATPLEAVATAQPAAWAVEADPAADIVALVRAMQAAGLGVAAVTTGGRVAGVVTAADVIAAVQRN